MTLIPVIGINAAPIASNACMLTSMIIEIIYLRKCIKLNLDYNVAVFKPIIITGLMGICSYLAQLLFEKIIKSVSIATLLAIIIAVVVYILGIVLFKIFDESDYHMLPYGDKIYNFLKKTKLVKP